MCIVSDPRILCVDDEPRVLDGLQRVCHNGFTVETAGSGAEALALLDRGEVFEVIVSDMQMPQMNGTALLAEFRTRAPDTIRVLLTGQADINAAITAVNHGQIFRFLSK
ncbi:MAG TPA: response regulator, partial [Polyangiaceae bacterium]